MRAAERWTEHTRRLPPLVVGDHVRIQNQTGSHLTKWDKTGVVIKVRQFDQYVVRVDGSGRITLCNHKFLRKYIPIQTQPPRRAIDDDLRHIIKPLLQPNTTITPLPRPTCMLAPPPSDQPPAASPSRPAPTGMGPIAPDLTPGSSPQRSTPNTPHHLALEAQSPPAPVIQPPAVAASPPPTPQPPPKKPPLAMRRLMDYNKKGTLEF